MRAIQHKTATRVLGAPKGVEHHECTPITVTDIEYAGGGNGIRTYWMPTEEEKADIAAGKPICVEFWGTTMPPCVITTEGREG